jgi:lysophospholipase L1-like esterase
MKKLKALPLALCALLLSPLSPTRAQDDSARESRLAIPKTDDGLPGSGPIRRYDWFQKLWLARRTAWSHEVQTDQGAVIFLGDSITQKWGDELGGSFPGLKVANRGISGDTTRGVLIRLKEDVLDLHPKAVVLLIGTNDLEEHAEPETIAANLKLIISAIENSNPETPIILCQVFPSSETKKRPAEKIKKVNALYAADVKGDRHVTLIETWPLFANPEGNAKKEEFPDLLHPNAQGYAKWAAALEPIFATLRLTETQADNFHPEPGFLSLFNGHDLTGWGFRTNNFDGKSLSSDGRYEAINGRIVVKTPPEGRRVEAMWTTRQFPGDFILKLQFRATPNADSGIFIREPQLQCRDYLLAGPYKTLQHYKPQDWNNIEVRVKDGVAHCTCNGEVLEDAMKLPASGPIGLEGDRGQMEYRHIELKELK